MKILRPFLFLGLSMMPAQAELLATFTGGDGATDTRLDRLPAILVNPGEAATPFLKPGPFSVTWTATLALDTRSRLNFSFEGEGKAVLRIGDEILLEEEGVLGTATMETARLNRGEHEVSLTFTSKDDGSGRFRLFWEERAFPRQTVPPHVFSTGARPQGEVLRHGRELFANHQCMACHQPGTPFGEGAMPELGKQAPRLDDIGSRVTEAWLTRWIASPTHLKPTTTMPAAVDHRTAEGARQSADIAAYLATLGAPAETPLPDPALAQNGGVHFHNFGCVACHTLPNVNLPDRTNGRVPLNNVATKFQPGALVGFLKDPRAHDPSTKMPDFLLSDEEARELAAFLTKESTGRHTPDPSEFPAGDPARGESLVKSLACAACHDDLPAAAAGDLAGIPPLEAIQGKDWGSHGCATGDSTEGGVRYPQFAKPDVEALAAFGATDLSSLGQQVPAEFATRRIETLRCTSCHGHDQSPPLLLSLHGESGSLVAHVEGHAERLEQYRPPLTYLGEMLHASYIRSMLDGAVNPRPRPWLDMRMPAFHEHPELLAAGMAHQHGIAPGTPDDRPHFEDAEELAGTGKILVGMDGGFACVICHAINDRKATAAFEVEGVNLALSQDRLQHGYYHRWMDDPQRVIPETKMPKYVSDGKSPLSQHYEGDARKQFDAIWEYLHALPSMEGK